VVEQTILHIRVVSKKMLNIPADIETAQAAGQIPSGISKEYLAQSRDQPAKIAIIFVGALTFVLVVARCYARLFLVKQAGLDDALAVFTMVGYLPCIHNGERIR
jgi:hypothetical protein